MFSPILPLFSNICGRTLFIGISVFGSYQMILKLLYNPTFCVDKPVFVWQCHQASRICRKLAISSGDPSKEREKVIQRESIGFLWQDASASALLWMRAHFPAHASGAEVGTINQSRGSCAASILHGSNSLSLSDPREAAMLIASSLALSRRSHPKYNHWWGYRDLLNEVFVHSCLEFQLLGGSLIPDLYTEVCKNRCFWGSVLHLWIQLLTETSSSRKGIAWGRKILSWTDLCICICFHTHQQLSGIHSVINSGSGLLLISGTKYCRWEWSRDCGEADRPEKI